LAVKWYRDNQIEQEKWLKKCTINDGEGTQLELWDVVQASLSNKTNRRTELMTRIGGFERYAKEYGHEADFYTLTTPSAFHSQLSAGGDNPAFEGFTVQQGQAWLSKMWARARAAIKKRGLTIYGFRISEPHHDGTPHWHMVLFCPPDHREPLRELLRKYWLSEYGHEVGAAQYRINVKRIESAKGSAAGYVAKYVAKNIDAYGVDQDHEAIGTEDTGRVEGALESDRPVTPSANAKIEISTAAAQTVERVTVWASLHGIRQFQQIGGPAVTVWRELRRLREPTKMKTLEPIRAACDQHDWCKYIQLNGGIERGRLGRSRLWTEVTGEINGYDELRGPQIAGVISVSESVATRLKTWVLSRRASAPSSESGLLRSALGPVSITVPGSAGGPGLSNPHGWTNPNETSTYGPN
jgi:Bacteriophage replication gene A protein (GPA)